MVSIENCVTDQDFLSFIHERLEYQYEVDPSASHMHRLRDVILSIPVGQITETRYPTENSTELRDMVYEKKVSKILDSIQKAALTTWDNIGFDVLSIQPNGIISQNDLISTVLDSNYMETYGGMTPEVLEVYSSLGYDERRIILAAAFRDSYYG